MGALISKAEYCRRFKVNKTRFKRLLADGFPISKDGKVSVAAAKKWLAENVDPARRDNWNGSDASLNELRRQREAIKVHAGKLALAKASGEMIDPQRSAEVHHRAGAHGTR